MNEFNLFTKSKYLNLNISISSFIIKYILKIMIKLFHFVVMIIHQIYLEKMIK